MFYETVTAFFANIKFGFDKIRLKIYKKLAFFLDEIPFQITENSVEGCSRNFNASYRQSTPK